MKVIGLLLLLLPVMLVGQQYQLTDLVNYGLQHSFSLQKSELNNRSASSALGTAEWNLLPEASVNTGVNKDLAPPIGSESLSSYAGITISKTISLNDAAYFNYRYAVLENNSAELRLKQARQAYVYQVFSAYVDVLGAVRQRSSLEENLQIQMRVWEQSKVLLQLGKITPFDVKQNEIAVMNSRISIIQLDNTIANTRSKLFSSVQMQDEGFPLGELELVIDKQIPNCEPDATADVILLHQELKHSDLELRQNKLDNFPRVNLAYSYDRRVGGKDFDFDTYSTNHGVSLSLSYPLLNFFKNGESNTRSKISRQISQLNIDEKSDQIVRDYNSATQELQYLKRMNELLGEKLAQTREQITQAEERYRLGLIELLELDKTRTNYIDADIAYNANRYQIIAQQEAINNLLSQPILGKW